jgi:hypothetical protein
MTLGDRLQAIVDSKHLPSKNQRFAKGLLSYYQQKRSLTSGRRIWVDRLEAMIEKNKNATVNPLVDEIDGIYSQAIEYDQSSWDVGFLESIRSQVACGNDMSDRQKEIYSKIKGNFSPAAIAEEQDWKSEYFEKHHETANILAQYYARTQYYRNFVNQNNDLNKAIDNIEERENYIPSKRFFNKLINNKFAKKVLAAHYSEPKYSAGSMVSARSGAAWMVHKALKKGGIVIDSKQPVISAANGAKRYQVLPIGSTNMIITEERYLKKFKKAKAKPATEEEIPF